MTECIHAKSILHLMTSKYVSKAGLCFKLVSLLTYELLMNTTLILVEITEQVLLFSLVVQSEKMTKKKPKFGALPTQGKKYAIAPSTSMHHTDLSTSSLMHLIS